MKALVTALVLLASPAVAQEWQCAPRDEVIAGLARNFDENRRFMGLAGDNSTVVEIYANDATGSWTITTSTPDGQMCLSASGYGFNGEAVPLPPGGVDG